MENRPFTLAGGSQEDRARRIAAPGGPSVPGVTRNHPPCACHGSGARGEKRIAEPTYTGKRGYFGSALGLGKRVEQVKTKEPGKFAG